MHAPNVDVSELMQALRCFLGENDMMGYLTMMFSHLVELRRVLKSIGSLHHKRGIGHLQEHRDKTTLALEGKTPKAILT